MLVMVATTAGDLIETLMKQQTVEDWIAFMHPDAEYQPLPDAPVYQGLTVIREWAETELANPSRPLPLPLSLSETADKAVVRGHVRFARGTDAKGYHVVEPAAWVVTVSDGKLRRVQAFSSWSAAEKAAGIAVGSDTPSRRLGPGLQLLRRMLSPRRLALR
jgi:ketosteroid isomerase-like protein